MMFERFTGDARAVVVGAQQHARRLGHSSIGCEHLLLATAATAEPASAALREHGVTPQAVEAEIVRLLGHLPFTPRAKQSMERSLAEARAREDSCIGVEHIALALVGMDDGIVPPILSALRASPAALRAAILDRYRRAS